MDPGIFNETPSSTRLNIVAGSIPGMAVKNLTHRVQDQSRMGMNLNCRDRSICPQSQCTNVERVVKKKKKQIIGEQQHRVVKMMKTKKKNNECRA